MRRDPSRRRAEGSLISDLSDPAHLQLGGKLLDQDATVTRPSWAAPVPENDRASYDGNKPLHEIEKDVARTRVRLNATIEALERELTPRRVIDMAAGTLRASLEPLAGPSRDRISTYAIPLALIAAGLGGLFMLRGRGYRADTSTSSDEAALRLVATRARGPAVTLIPS